MFTDGNLTIVMVTRLCQQEACSFVRHAPERALLQAAATCPAAVRERPTVNREWSKN